MPRNPGKQKRANKQKKRRAARQKARSARRPAAAAAPSLPQSDDLTELCGYDADHAPAAKKWLGLGEQERLDRVKRYHETAFEPGRRPPSLLRHAGMHVIVENQIASREPPQVAEALGRLKNDGMSRHDAIHAIGWLLTEHMRQAMEKNNPVDEGAYARDLEDLSLASWLAQAKR